jgi:NAD(P)H-hydrate repair Nnr-like enzyme with NAD(P)H-hydrate dehydratase domain
VASAALVLALGMLARVAGWAQFTGYPLLRAPAGARTLGVAVVLLAAALAPFLDRRGIER